MKTFPLKTILTLLVLLPSSAQAAAPSGSLIVNGSFEDPVIAGSFQLFSSIPGWGPTGSCGNIEIDRNAFGAAADGNQSNELNTTCVNGVSQVVATTPGASYSLAFAFAARPGTTAAQNQMEIRFDGLDVDQLGPRAPAAGLQWSVHQYEVTATGSSATLSFQGTDPTTGDGVGTELDFVSLVPLVLNADPLTEIPGSFYQNKVVCDLNNLPVSSECGSEPVVITPQTLLGRAYGLSANVSLLGLPLINRPPTPDTGEIATTLDSSTSVPCVATLLSGPLHAHALCASVTTTAFPGSSTAVASVADLSLSVATLPHVKIGAVHSTSTTSCDGSTGATTIAYLKIGSTVVIAAPTLVAPNTPVTLGLVSLVLNEQIPGPTGGLTVNGIHLSVNGGGLAQTNLVVGSARSNIGNCP